MPLGTSTGRQVKEFGQSNDLIERLQNDTAFENADLSNALEAQPNWNAR